MDGEFSQLLFRWGEGDESAFAELMPVVYGELRRLAMAALEQRQQGRQAILEPTTLVHEAWLRLVGQRPSLRCGGAILWTRSQADSGRAGGPLAPQASGEARWVLNGCFIRK